ncbi:unnamed protein product [Cuscuta epithymum]|uniref:Uncharacterized protein n=1 Tax=Cuscuta epithymum TaxID=186058 RepID=A0AAV0DGG1_9ASTE|nr:unnamed protein product [Cuscuta epithymum]
MTVGGMKAQYKSIDHYGRFDLEVDEGKAVKAMKIKQQIQ